MTTSAHEHQTSKIVARTLTEAITDGKQQCDGASLAASPSKECTGGHPQGEGEGGVGGSTVLWKH